MATLIVCGINHHGVPVDVRERVSMPKHCKIPALQMLKSQQHIQEVAIVSTCNRTEIYAVAENTLAGLAAIEQFFIRAAQQHGGTIKPNLRLLHDDAALQLFRVASGLDSLVIGEGQILGQIKEAYEIAREAGTAGPTLNKLFSLALKCGKRVRTETGMSQKAVSVASAAVELARLEFGHLHGKKALIIGAGRMASLAAKHLTGKKNSAEVTVLNRSQSGLDQLRTMAPGVRTVCADPNAVSPDVIAEFDMIVVATSSSGYVLKPDAVSKQPGKTVLFDLSVPRNVDPGCAKAAKIKMFDIDALQAVVERNLLERSIIAERAEPILGETLDEFNSWKRSYAAAPAVVSYRNRMEALRKKCVARAGAAAVSKQELDRMSVQLMNKFMHEGTMQLRNQIR